MSVSRSRFVLFVITSMLGLACGGSSSNGPPADAATGVADAPAARVDAASARADAAAARADAGVIGGTRPVTVHVPPGYVPGTAMPLVIMLHGYSASGDLEELYLQLTPVADARGFLYAHPDGTVDSQGLRFWNATDACCDLDGSGVDDSTYLSTVITQIEAAYTVDPKRVFLIGHSNGGFMTHRMACDHADQIAAIADLAGAQWADLSRCTPSSAVSVVAIHGTADTLIAYNGGSIGAHAYPGATTTVADWVTLDGCSPTVDNSAPPLDLDSSLAGNETTVARWGTGCAPGGHVELWTITGGSHLPARSATFDDDMIDFLYAHPKP